MYDDLITAIRKTACQFKECGMCPKGKEPCIDRYALQVADAIEELSKSRWIPVEERLPDNEEKQYLVTIDSSFGVRYTTTAYYAKNLEEVGGYSLQGKRRGGFYGYIDELGFLEKPGVRYWMPVPEPPKEEE